MILDGHLFSIRTVPKLENMLWCNFQSFRQSSDLSIVGNCVLFRTFKCRQLRPVQAMSAVFITQHQHYNKFSEKLLRTNELTVCKFSEPYWINSSGKVWTWLNNFIVKIFQMMLKWSKWLKLLYQSDWKKNQRQTVVSKNTR